MLIDSHQNLDKIIYFGLRFNGIWKSDWVFNQSVNQLLCFTVHKCMPKSFQDYLGNKVTFLKWEDNGLLLTSLNFSAGFLPGITITNLEN